MKKLSYSYLFLFLLAFDINAQINDSDPEDTLDYMCIIEPVIFYHLEFGEEFAYYPTTVGTYHTNEKNREERKKLTIEVINKETQDYIDSNYYHITYCTHTGEESCSGVSLNRCGYGSGVADPGTYAEIVNACLEEISNDCNLGTWQCLGSFSMSPRIDSLSVVESGDVDCQIQNDQDGDGVPDYKDKCDRESGTPSLNGPDGVFDEWYPDESLRGCDIECSDDEEKVDGQCVPKCLKLTERNQNTGKCECSMPALPPLTDPIAKDLDQGNPVRFSPTEQGQKLKRDYEECLLPRTQKVLSQIGSNFSAVATSAYRPPDYQTHLYEVVRLKTLIENYEFIPDECSERVNVINKHFKQHFPKNSSAKDVVVRRENSNHSVDHALDFDWDPLPAHQQSGVLGSSGLTIDDIASQCGLCRPLPRTDEIIDTNAPRGKPDTMHFEAKGKSNFGNCFNTQEEN